MTSSGTPAMGLPPVTRTSLRIQTGGIARAAPPVHARRRPAKTPASGRCRRASGRGAGIDPCRLLQGVLEHHGEDTGASPVELQRHVEVSFEAATRTVGQGKVHPQVLIAFLEREAPAAVAEGLAPPGQTPL